MAAGKEIQPRQRDGPRESLVRDGGTGSHRGAPDRSASRCCADASRVGRGGGGGGGGGGARRRAYLWLGVAGSHTGAPPAVSALKAGLVNPMGLLAVVCARRHGRADQRQGARLRRAADHPDKLNLADLRRTITQAAIRDTKAGTVYPKPLATLPKLSGIDAAYPDYAEFFGTDGAYATYSLAAAGQWQTAMQHQHAPHRVADRERQHREGRPRDLLHRGRVLRRQHRAG